MTWILVRNPDEMPIIGIIESKMIVSSQPLLNAVTMERMKVERKKQSIPIFSPIPSCSLLRSLDRQVLSNKCYITTYSVILVAKSDVVFMSYQLMSCLKIAFRNSIRIRKTWKFRCRTPWFLSNGINLDLKLIIRLCIWLRKVIIDISMPHPTCLSAA